MCMRQSAVNKEFAKSVKMMEIIGMDIKGNQNAEGLEREKEALRKQSRNTLRKQSQKSIKRNRSNKSMAEGRQHNNRKMPDMKNTSEYAENDENWVAF